jgi:uncharacterized protein YjbI with pentapeptide repeats
MTTGRHISIFKLHEGEVDAWNRWREKNPEIKPDLTGIRLFKIELSGANLSKSFLWNADIRGANFTEANLTEANFLYATLVGCNFSKVNLSQASFNAANLTRVNFSQANLSGASLSGANVHQGKFIGANLTKANLTKANLTEAKLTGANFTEAHLSTGIFFKTDLSDTNLTQANLTNANLVEANLNNANLKSANLSCANLAHAKLNNADLRNADLSYANLSGADLTGAELSRANLLGTVLGLPGSPILNNEVSNQGVKAPYEWNNFYFRSKTEIKIAEALDRAGVLFYPNCKARLNAPEGRNGRESDFLVFHTGKWGILEVDGEPWHPPSRTVHDHERDRLFKAHGIRIVEHYDATRCWNQPDKVVEEFLKILSQA